MFINTEKKYAPKSLNEFIYPNAETKDIVESYVLGCEEKPLILYGGSGTGKSSLQKFIPDAVENHTAKVQRLLCADIKSAADVHRHYGNNKHLDNLFRENDRYNYIIIEEFLVTNKKISDAFKIELDKRMGVDLTIISTNHFGKIDPGIKSRAITLELLACEPSIFYPHAKKIFDMEGVHASDQELINCLDVTYTLHKDNRKYYQAMDKLLRTI